MLQLYSVHKRLMIARTLVSPTPSISAIFQRA